MPAFCLVISPWLCRRTGAEQSGAVHRGKEGKKEWRKDEIRKERRKERKKGSSNVEQWWNREQKDNGRAEGQWKIVWRSAGGQCGPHSWTQTQLQSPLLWSALQLADEVSDVYVESLSLLFWLQTEGDWGGVPVFVCVPLWDVGRLTCSLWCQCCAFLSCFSLLFFFFSLAYYASVTEAELSFPPAGRTRIQPAINAIYSVPVLTVWGILVQLASVSKNKHKKKGFLIEGLQKTELMRQFTRFGLMIFRVMSLPALHIM